MIAFMPELYPDELAYSWLARYYVKSGHLTLTAAVEDLYVHKYTAPDMEFLNELRPEVLEVMGRYCSLETLVQEHTMFPSYARFLPADRKQGAYDALLQMHGNFNNLLAIPKNQRGKGKFLRYCPVCVREDRMRYGETFWHRSHQIGGVRICGTHHCFLRESGISMDRKAPPGLWDAEGVAMEGGMETCGDRAEMAFTEYAVRVFHTGMDFHGRVPVADFLKMRLQTYARTGSGAGLDLERLYAEYQDFCGGSRCMTKVEMQKILNGVRFNYADICKLALFAGIPEEELACIPDKVRGQLQKPVFLEVAEELHLDYQLVEMVGEAVLKRYEGRERVVQRKRRNAVWERMDDEMLPCVRDTIKGIYQTEGERPGKVSLSLVERKMGWPPKRLDKLPKCRAAVMEYQETQKEYWAREAAWAYRKLVQEGQGVNWKHLRVLTNMRNADFQGCKPYLGKHVSGADLECLMGLI